MKHVGPLNPALIPESTPSKLRMRDFLKAWTAIDAHTNFIVRYPQMDEPDVTQVSKGCLGIHYASFNFGLNFPCLNLSWNGFVTIK